jgi:glycine/D-amino acid oxidase-like deaminating enzyme
MMPTTRASSRLHPPRNLPALSSRADPAAAPSDHPRSYYAATRNDVTSYPALAGSTRADVCVIGGGFTGVSAALTLAERGMDVVLLEQHRIGWGASGRNGGQLIAGMSGEARVRRFHGLRAERMIDDIAWRGHAIVEQRIERYGIDCDLRYGYMDVAIKPRHMRALEEQERALRRLELGDHVQLVPRGNIRDFIASDAYIGGLLNRRNGHLHPLNLCAGEARAAAALGARLHERTEAIQIVHGPRPRVRTARGDVDAACVLIAGDSYHRLERPALSGLVFAAGSYIVATERLSADEVRTLDPHGLAFCDPNHVLDYFRFSRDGRLLFGGRCNYSGREPQSIRASIVPRMLRVYPQLAGKRVDFEWGGRIGIVINRVPLIGRTADNVYHSVGYSGHGVNFSHVAAEIVADAMAGQLARFDVFARIPHRKLPFGDRIGREIVALGMLYYRLLDLL